MPAIHAIHLQDDNLLNNDTYVFDGFWDKANKKDMEYIKITHI